MRVLPDQDATGTRPSDEEVAGRLGLASPELVDAVIGAGARARQLLYNANVRLAYKIAGRYWGEGVAFEDLTQVTPPAHAPHPDAPLACSREQQFLAGRCA